MEKGNQISSFTRDAPPAYGFDDPYTTPQGSSWHPRNWGKKTWIGVVLGAVVLIVVIIVGAVVGVRNNAYPSYSRLNYTLEDDYSGSTFFDNFDYFTGFDPAHGFVHYVDQPGSESLNLTFASANSAILRVDTTDTNATTGRKSARISSKKQYNSGLFIFDVLNSPYGCSTWPALWLYGDQDTWPLQGEIDVMEAVNLANTGNQMTLHTTEGCKMDRKRKQTGKTLAKDCWNQTDSNEGCGVQGSTATFGQEFNQNGGGVYATELRSDGIRMWFFPRNAIPADITAGTSPDPSTWGEALSDFPKTDCDISKHFTNQSIIANIDLCGDFAGQASVFSKGCSGTCSDFVAFQASSFQTAFWEFKSFKVYSAAT
ncbi:glycoside hydrolase family 16 protein [Rhizodiscina lignyota]|uniref:endo-1,3(4)-beta-glucanase n=1 Tax=Rhizodiscina lignyota TaxID=1504668 RepID=A0A9P4ITU4_9PEZI|nr:glycoside hydrolase family 16 protein [Rhizodiscina lignyota]